MLFSFSKLNLMSNLKKILSIVVVLWLFIPKDLVVILSNVTSYIEHFEHHNDNHTPISVLEFAFQHLIVVHSHDGQHQGDHDKLPFNSTHSLNLSNIIPLFIHKTEVCLVLISQDSKSILQTYQENVLTHYSNSIWQPPRIS